MCQLAWDLNSDRYNLSQTTHLNNSRTPYHSPTSLTAFCCLQCSMYVATERRARGGRGDIKREFRKKKAKDKRKKWAVQM